MSAQSRYTVTPTGPVTFNCVSRDGRRIEIVTHLDRSVSPPVKTSVEYWISGRPATEEEVRAVMQEIHQDAQGRHENLSEISPQSLPLVESREAQGDARDLPDA